MSAPVRTCAGCRTRAPKAELTRLAWDEGSRAVVVDDRQRLPGRGVYLHPGCAPSLLRNRGVGRGLRREVDAAAVRVLLESLASRER